MGGLSVDFYMYLGGFTDTSVSDKKSTDLRMTTGFLGEWKYSVAFFFLIKTGITVGDTSLKGNI